MKILIPLCAALALTACGSTPGRFDNLLLTSLQGDRAFVASTYGPVGITAELRAEDAREIKRMREAARDAGELMRLVQADAARKAAAAGKPL
jgi:hypothetical protein